MAYDDILNESILCSKIAIGVISYNNVTLVKRISIASCLSLTFPSIENSILLLIGIYNKQIPQYI